MSGVVRTKDRIRDLDNNKMYGIIKAEGEKP